MVDGYAISLLQFIARVRYRTENKSYATSSVAQMPQELLACVTAPLLVAVNSSW
jgi:hypothetical protein